jgi:2-methylcitrate dehydratase PrpD
MSAIETLGAFISDGIRGQVPDDVAAAARLHLTDIVGAWVAAHPAVEAQALIELARAMRTPAATSAGPGNLLIDVQLNCALARLSEFDDIHLTSGITPGGIVVPSALTIAETMEQVDHTALIESIVAGYEAITRLGAVIGGPTALYRGIWPSYFAAPFGVAAVASRLYELNAKQAAHALALALAMASPNVGHHNAPTTSRWFAIGNAARNGLYAALAARAGFTSDLNLIDSGFLTQVYGIAVDQEAATRDLGIAFALTDCSFKPWCAARQTMAATQALKELMQSGVTLEGIEQIEVAVPPPYLKMVDHGVRAGDRASYLTSLPYRLAIAAHEPDADFDVRQAPKTLQAPVDALMGKVTLAADDSLLAHYPRAWPARIRVRDASGLHERLVIHIPGDPQRPFDHDAVERKFRRIVAPVTAPEPLLARTRAVASGQEPVATLVRDIARFCAPKVERK